MKKSFLLWFLPDYHRKTLQISTAHPSYHYMFVCQAQTYAACICFTLIEDMQYLASNTDDPKLLEMKSLFLLSITDTPNNCWVIWVILGDDRTLRLYWKSEMYWMKMNGDSAVICGGPELLLSFSDTQPLSPTNWVLFVRWCIIQKIVETSAF